MKLEITRQDLLVLACASTDETRYNLNGVYFDHENGHPRTIATDGHTLAMVDTGEKLGSAFEFEPFILGIENVKILAGWLKNKTCLPVTVEKDEERSHSIICSQGIDRRMTLPTIDGEFPAYRQVLPEVSRPCALTEDACLSAVYHRRAATICEHFMRGHRMKPIRMNFDGELASIRYTAEDMDTERRLTVVVMPMRK